MVGPGGVSGNGEYIMMAYREMAVGH
jgi:hypothetical protein